VQAKVVSVIVETCPTCGAIQIFWGSRLIHTYSLHSASTRKQVFLVAVSFRRVNRGTVRIRVSSSGKPVIIDGLGVTRL